MRRGNLRDKQAEIGTISNAKIKDGTLQLCIVEKILLTQSLYQFTHLKTISHLKSILQSKNYPRHKPNSNSLPPKILPSQWHHHEQYSFSNSTANTQKKYTKEEEHKIQEQLQSQLNEMMEQFDEFGLEHEIGNRMQKKENYKWKAPIQLTNLFKNKKNQNTVDVLQWLNCFKETKFIPLLKNHLKYFYKANDAFQALNQSTYGTLSQLENKFATQQIFLKNQTHFQLTVWENVYQQILKGELQNLSKLLFEAKLDDFYEMLKTYISMMKNGAQSTKFRQYEKSIRNWMQEKDERCPQLIGEYLLGETVEPHWQLNRLNPKLGRVYEKWKIISYSLKWLPTYRNSEHVFCQNKINHFLLMRSKLPLHQLNFQDFFHLFLYEQILRKTFYIDQLCFLTIFLCIPAICQIGSIFNSDIDRQRAEDELVRKCLNLTDHEKLVKHFLPFMEVEKALIIIVSEKKFVESIQWQQILWMMRVENKEKFVRDIAIRSIQLYGNITFFFESIPQQYRSTAFDLDLIQTTLKRYIFLNQQKNEEADSIYHYLSQLREAKMVEEDKIQMVNVQMLFFWYNFCSFLLDRNIRMIQTHLAFFLQKSQVRRNEFPMMSESIRREITLFQNNPHYVGLIGQPFHLRFLQKNQQYFNLYLGFIDILKLGIQFLMKSQSKLVKLNECLLWFKELRELLNVGYREWGGQGKERYKRKQEQILRISSVYA